MNWMSIVEIQFLYARLSTHGLPRLRRPRVEEKGCCIVASYVSGSYSLTRVFKTSVLLVQYDYYVLT